MELIDKAAVVAEIERRKHKLLDNIMFERDKEWVVRTAHQLNRIILFLDTLEVKEVDLEKYPIEMYEEVGWRCVDKNADKRKYFTEGYLQARKQLLSKAIDGVITFDYYGNNNKTYGCIAHDSFCYEDLGLKDRDEVKILILKK